MRGPPAAIELGGVTKAFPNGAVAVRAVTLAVRAGERLVLLGPSGGGKTTLLRLMNALVRPTRGVVRLNGLDLAALDPVALRRSVGYVIQQVGLFPHMTVYENIVLPLTLQRAPASGHRRRAASLMDLVRLPRGLLARMPRELSGGQQQRVGLARALVTDPEVLLMDEPFGALDPLTRAGVRRDVLSLLHAIRKTVVMVTHDLAEAFEFATRIAVVNHGRLEQVGRPLEVRRRPATPFIRRFLRAGEGPSRGS